MRKPYCYPDINSIQCATRISGEKAIKVVGDYAYVQYADGMRVYMYSQSNAGWVLVNEVVCTNY